jgi:uncharacterized protein (TIGR00369 family)
VDSGNGDGHTIAAFAKECHGACLACRDREDGGLGLRFHGEPDGSVVATFECDPKYQSYPDRLHGGITALLLDSAMTHCLFARQIHGVTARLSIRYHRPMELGVGATIRARVIRQMKQLIELEAVITQNDRVAARAEARFFRLPGPPAPLPGETQGG